jgi:hypothetical protein
MVSGCGLSRKSNRKAGTTFLYFWWYEYGKKREQYLGRVEDIEAETRGLRMMLSFYRKQDESLHHTIGEIVERLTTMRPHKPLPNIHVEYLPETEA